MGAEKKTGSELSALIDGYEKLIAAESEREQERRAAVEKRGRTFISNRLSVMYCDDVRCTVFEVLSPYLKGSRKADLEKLRVFVSLIRGRLGLWDEYEKYEKKRASLSGSCSSVEYEAVSSELDSILEREESLDKCSEKMEKLTKGKVIPRGLDAVAEAFENMYRDRGEAAFDGFVFDSGDFPGISSENLSKKNMKILSDYRNLLRIRKEEAEALAKFKKLSRARKKKQELQEKEEEKRNRMTEETQAEPFIGEAVGDFPVQEEPDEDTAVPAVPPGGCADLPLESAEPAESLFSDAAHDSDGHSFDFELKESDELSSSDSGHEILEIWKGPDPDDPAFKDLDVIEDTDDFSDPDSGDFSGVSDSGEPDSGEFPLFSAADEEDEASVDSGEPDSGEFKIPDHCLSCGMPLGFCCGSAVSGKGDVVDRLEVADRIRQSIEERLSVKKKLSQNGFSWIKAVEWFFITGFSLFLVSRMSSLFAVGG